MKLLRALLPVGGLAMLIWGLMRGENLKVLAKAINVCLECVGIG